MKQLFSVLLTSSIFYCNMILAVNNPIDFSLNGVSDDKIQADWTLNLNGDSVILVFNITNNFDIPASGASYSTGYIFPSGTEVVYKGTDLQFLHTGLSPETYYYYQIWSFDAGHVYSTGIIDSVKTMCLRMILPFHEGFENGGSMPACWTQEHVTGTEDWLFADGNPATNNPDHAYADNYCAYLPGNDYFSQKTKLILPVFDLSDTSAEISFWAFVPMSSSLKIYYKTSSTASWTQLFTCSVCPAWKHYIVDIVNTTDEFYIAFEATTPSGCQYFDGPAIDQISICHCGICCSVPDAPVISGPFETCIGFGTPMTYTVSPGADSYYWSLSGNLSFLGQGTNSIFIPDYLPPGIQPPGFQVTASVGNSCGMSPSAVFSVCVGVGALISSSINGNFTPCVGSIQTYSINISEGPDCGFAWTYPVSSGYLLIDQGQTLTSSYLTLQIGSGSGTISVQGYCGWCATLCPTNMISTSLSPMNVPSQPSAISGDVSPCQGSSQNYNVNNVSGINYYWTVPPGWTITGGQGTNQLSVLTGSGSGTVEVTPGNTCGTGISRTLMVNPDPLPDQPSVINGLTVMCEGDTLNYSVINETGITYIWGFPSGWIQNGGGTTNNVSVIAGSSTGNVSVTPFNTCGSGFASNLAVNPDFLPVITSGIAGPVDLCNGATGSYLLTGTGDYYLWEFPPGWVQTSGDSTSSVEAIPGINSGYIIATPYNQCGNGEPDSLQVTPDLLLNAPGSITGSSNPCQGTIQTFIVPAEAGADFYEWIFPSGWTIQGSSTENIVDVIAGSIAGNIGVLQGNNCGWSDTVFLYIEPAQGPGLIDTIFGEIYPCTGSQQVYSVTGDTSLTYNWTIPGGWTLLSGTDSSQIMLICGPDTGIITVTPTNVCGTGTTQQVNVYPVDIPGSPVSILGNMNICVGDTYSYSVEIPTGDHYIWDIPAGWTVVGCDTCGTIILIPSDSSGTIIVSPVNYCGTGSSVFIKPVLSNIPDQPVIAGDVNICEGSTAIFSVNDVAGETYFWSVPSGYSILAGQGTGSVEIEVGNVQDTITVTASNICGQGQEAELVIYPFAMITASVVISVSPDTAFCEGETVYLDAIPVNQGSNPAYLWYINDTLYSTSSSASIVDIQNGFQAYLVMTADTECLVGNPVFSDTIFITVYNNPAPPVISVNNDTLSSSYAFGNQWCDLVQMISGADDQQYIVTADGDYYVIFTDTNGCQSVSDTVTVILSSSIDPDAISVLFYPNPVKDRLHLLFSEEIHGDIRLQLLDIAGRVVLTDRILGEPTMSLDVSAILPGAYSLVIQAEQKTFVYKIVIMH